MLRAVIVVYLLLAVCPGAVASPGGPEPRAPADECEVTELPAGFYIEECEGEYVIGTPWGR